MFETAFRKILKSNLLVLLAFFFNAILTSTIILAALDVDTTFQHQILEGALSVDIVDAAGASVASPTVSFGGSIYYSFDAQDTTGTLGTSTEKIRVTNGRAATDTWNMTIAAKLGPGTLWTTGTYTHPFDSVSGADSGRLTIDPTTNGVITPASGCSALNLSKGSSNFFVNGTTDSITLLSAGAGADTLCYWDFTGVSLTQRIPGAQEPGTYSLAMTISVI